MQRFKVVRATLAAATGAAVLGLAGAASAGTLRSVQYEDMCAAGEAPYVGDFNGDGVSDLLCLTRANGNQRVRYGSATGGFGSGGTWSRAARYCYHAGASLQVADFNGDGRDDLFCHDGAGGRWVLFADAAGTFTRDGVFYGAGFCYHAGAQVLAGDLNGDRRADLLCHDTKNGDKWVLVSDPNGGVGSTAVYYRMGYCYHAGAWLRLADTNGDGRKDLVCNDGTGAAWVVQSAPLGLPIGGAWSGGNICSAASGGGTSAIEMADFNGDGREDIACWRGAPNAVSYWYAQPGGGFTYSPNQVVNAPPPPYATSGLFYPWKARLDADAQWDLQLVYIFWQ